MTIAGITRCLACGMSSDKGEQHGANCAIELVSKVLNAEREAAFFETTRYRNPADR